MVRDAQHRLHAYSLTQGLNYSSTQDSTTRYFYTANGDLTQTVKRTDTTRYSYDAFGSLCSVLLPNGTLIEYLIDGQNRRIGKKINGQIVKRWIYSGQLSPIAELDSVGNVVSQFVGGYMIKNGNTYQLITDHLGSVRLVVDVNTGEVAQQIDYDEYGNVTQNTNPDFQPFAYAGGLYDTQTKLARFGARDYDPNIGRWTKKDPIGFEGKVSNFYEYVINDPLNMFDRNGLQQIDPYGYFQQQGSAEWAAISEIVANNATTVMDAYALGLTVMGMPGAATVVGVGTVIINAAEGKYTDAQVSAFLTSVGNAIPNTGAQIGIDYAQLLYDLLFAEDQSKPKDSKPCPKK
jgi:RHS repeat-associated protein